MEEEHARPTMYQACLLHARADRVLRMVVAEGLEQWKLTMMEWLLLGVINEGPDNGITLSDIARRLDVSQPQVTALMNKADKQSLVRQKVQRSDRRSRRVVLSAKGSRLLAEVEAGLSHTIQDWLTELPRDQLQAYMDTVLYISMSRPASEQSGSAA